MSEQRDDQLRQGVRELIKEHGAAFDRLANEDGPTIDLSIYQPGAHPSGHGDEHCCYDHKGSDDYEHEDELFVDDGQHVVFLYWSEIPNNGVHTGWGGTDVWACRCGWRNKDNDLFKKPFPDQPPYGEAGSEERKHFIEWQTNGYTKWAPYGFDFYAMHAWETRAWVVEPGFGFPRGRRGEVDD